MGHCDGGGCHIADEPEVLHGNAWGTDLFAAVVDVVDSTRVLSDDDIVASRDLKGQRLN